MPKPKGCSLDTNCVIEVLNKIILILSLCVLLPPSLRRHDIDVAVQMSMMEEHISNAAQLWSNFFFLLIISIIYYNNLLSVLQFWCNTACCVFCSCCSHAHPGKIDTRPSSFAKIIQLCTNYSTLQKLFNFAKIIQVCKKYSSLQKLFNFAKIIQVCKNYSSLQKLFKFAKIIQFCKNYSSLQKLFKFAKIIQVCKNYSSLQKLLKFAKIIEVCKKKKLAEISCTIRVT